MRIRNKLAPPFIFEAYYVNNWLTSKRILRRYEVYNSLDELIYYNSFVACDIHGIAYNKGYGHDNNFVIKDQLGVIPLDLLRIVVPKPSTYRIINYYSKGRGRYRDGPILGTGRWSFGNWYKRPQVMNEMRHNEMLVAEGYDYLIRSKRRNANLPNAWDDECRSDWRNKNWKRHRKTQWK